MKSDNKREIKKKLFRNEAFWILFLNMFSHSFFLSFPITLDQMHVGRENLSQIIYMKLLILFMPTPRYFLLFLLFDSTNHTRHFTLELLIEQFIFIWNISLTVWIKLLRFFLFRCLFQHRHASSIFHFGIQTKWFRMLCSSQFWWWQRDNMCDKCKFFGWKMSTSICLALWNMMERKYERIAYSLEEEKK